MPLQMRSWMILAWCGCLAVAAAADKGPTAKEKQALAALAEQVQGRLLYGHKARIWRVDIGTADPVDCGPGTYARWAPDGRALAIYHGGTIEVLDLVSGKRHQLVDGVRSGDGPPLEVTLHRDTPVVLYLADGKQHDVHRVPLVGGKPVPLGLKQGLTGEITASADGTRLVGRAGSDIWAVDLESGAATKYAKGCSPGISPDGSTMMNNLGGHTEIALHRWPKGQVQKLKARIAPDQRWDNHHWSNQQRWITAQGERGGGESYLVDLDSGRCYRQTWCGETTYPDAWIAGAGGEKTAAGGGMAGAAWPSEDKGLVFRWEQSDTDNVAPAAAGGHVARFTVRDTARYAPDFDLLLPAGGHAEAALPTTDLNGTWTLHLACAPAGDGDGILATFLADDGAELLRVALRGEVLEVTAGDEGLWQWPRTDREGKPFRLGLIYDAGDLTPYANGRLAKITWNGTFPAAAAQLRLGAAEGGWTGRVGHMALWQRALDEVAIATVDTPLAKRKPQRIARSRYAVTLVATSAAPSVEQMSTYRRALVVHRYQVDRVLAGAEPESDIAVARWAVLDRRPINGAVPLAGAQGELTLESWDAHPELESELQINDLEDPRLPMFFDVGLDP